MPSRLPCPVCGEFHFHKSRTRTVYEKLKKIILRQRPYRCHKCGYRTWIKLGILKPKISYSSFLMYFAIFLISLFVSYILKLFLF